MAMQAGYIFLVASDGHMTFSHHSANPEDLQWTRIRVVGRLGRKCMVDPEIELTYASTWRLWVWEGRPL